MEIIVPSSKIYDYNTSSNISDNSVKSVSIDQKKISLINEQQKNISKTLKIDEDYFKGEYKFTMPLTTTKQAYQVTLEGTPPQNLSGEMWCGYNTLIPKAVEKTITQQRFVDNYYITSISPVIKFNFKVASSPINTYFDRSRETNDANRFVFYAYSIVENTYKENYYLTGTENLQSIQDSYYSNSNYYTSKNGSSANMAVKFENFGISLAYFLTRDDINDEPSAKEIARIDISQTDLSQKFDISYDETDEDYSITAKFVPNFKVLQSILDETLSYNDVWMVVNGAVTEFVLESVEIQLNEQIIKLEEETETVKKGENASAYSYTEENEFLQESNEFNLSSSKNKNAEDIISNWQNGKETLSIRCSIGDYYDANENKVISPEYQEKMLFDIYDEVLPCYNTPYGDAPLSILDGKPKKFLVLGSKINFDGAVWQELTLQESGTSNAIISNGSKGLAYEEIDGQLYCTGIGTCNDTDILIANYANGKNVYGISHEAFYENLDIEKLTIAKGILYIGNSAFEGCFNLTNVIIQNGVLRVGFYAFQFCRNLKKVSIPKSLTFMEQGAFDSCHSIEQIKIDESNPTFKNINGNHIYSKDGTKLIKYAVGDISETFKVPDTVKIIGDRAFEHSENLKNISINGVESIGWQAFSGCYSLTSVEIPDTVKNMELYAFGYCFSLTTVYIGNGLENIEQGAFNYCENLSTVYIGKGLKTIKSGAFIGCKNIKDIYYNGTSTEWNNIEIEAYNAPLLNATIHFNA